MITTVNECKNAVSIIVNNHTINIYYVLFSIEYWHATRTLWLLPILAAGICVFTHETPLNSLGETFFFGITCVVLKSVWIHSLAILAAICACVVYWTQPRRSLKNLSDLPQTVARAPSLPVVEEHQDEQRCFYLF